MKPTVKRTRKAKLFRRKMWAVMFPDGDILIKDRRNEFVFPQNATRVELAEIRKAGAKRGRGK